MTCTGCEITGDSTIETFGSNLSSKIMSFEEKDLASELLISVTVAGPLRNRTAFQFPLDQPVYSIVYTGPKAMKSTVLITLFLY